jgi:rare lipoprotein A (peptidoglycan hydrolase)
MASSRSVVVRIADRGPWIRDRVLDLSLGAARSLGITDRGVAYVRAEVLVEMVRLDHYRFFPRAIDTGLRRGPLASTTAARHSLGTIRRVGC